METFYPSKMSLRIASAVTLAGLFVMMAFLALQNDIFAYNFYLVLLLVIIFLFVFGLSVGQHTASPIKDMLKDTHYFIKGGYGVKYFKEYKGELGQLATVFNKIAEEFDKNKSEVRNLDSKIQLKTRTLEEIISLLERKLKNRTTDFQKTIENLEKSQSQLRLKEKEILMLKKQIKKHKARKKANA